MCAVVCGVALRCAPLVAAHVDDGEAVVVRALEHGDQVAHAVGVSSEPDCGVRRLSPDDKFLVAATDGLWEFLPNAEVVARVAEVSSQSGSPRASTTCRRRGRRPTR